jgi:hypothetical protein
MTVYIDGHILYAIYIHTDALRENMPSKTRKAAKAAKGTRKRSARGAFSEEDYSSRDGMLTSVWGPSTWHMLHTISFNYPAEPTPVQKRQYMSFIKSLEHVLPCGACRKNLRNNFKKLPLTMRAMRSRATFSRYVYDLHEHVNTMLGKKSGLSYEDVRERYEHFRARCGGKPVARVEAGCVKPMVGKKSKCVLRVVPHDTDVATFEIDGKCMPPSS